MKIKLSYNDFTNIDDAISYFLQYKTDVISLTLNGFCDSENLNRLINTFIVCPNLQSISLDKGNLIDTNNISTIVSMIRRLQNLKTLDLSNNLLHEDNVRTIALECNLRKIESYYRESTL